MGRLLKLMLPAWPWMVTAIVFSVLTVFSNIGLMGMSAFLIATAALHPPVMALSIAIVGVRSFGLSRAILRYVERYISHDATFRLLSRLRVWFYKSIEPLAPAGLMKYRTGDLLSRIAGDVDSLQFFYLRVLAPPFVAILVLLGMVYLLKLYSFKFILLLVGGFAASGLVLPLVVHRMNNSCQDDLSQARGQLNALVVDSIQGMAELAAFNQIPKQAEKLFDISERLYKLQKRSGQAIAVADSMNSLIMQITVWLLLVIGVPMVREGILSGVDLAVAALVVQSSFEAVQPLATVSPHLRDSKEAAARLFELLDDRPNVPLKSHISEPVEIDLSFEKVSFSYGKQGCVLQDVSFTLPAGKRLAIVGESGAGKSSIVSLLLRFWDYQQGSIKLGGAELKECQPESLQRIIGVVPQSTYLFNASIKDNILLAKPDADEKELQEALEGASLSAVIDRLPIGYDTKVGENGHSLSGGQRQRVAIARALLKNSPLLILDEPTVGLDAVTELEIMESIKSAMAGRTTILITHRLIGLEMMDDIIVLDKGQIIERGTQSQLLSQKGLFFRMWTLQNDRLPDNMC